jgi:hypothetical protein
MNYVLISMTTASIVIAVIGVFVAYLSVKRSAQSIQELHSVHQELDLEFTKVKETNQDTQNTIARIARLFDASEGVGLEMIYVNRNEALRDFSEFIQIENEEVVIIGSSLLGLFLIVADFEEILKNKPKVFKFILTHPDESENREAPEGRDQGVIRGEIIECIHKLMNWGVPADNIQLYRGSPTVFMIRTSQHMLLNPYPYATEAYRCFCIQVASRGGIYRQYSEKHYEKVWDSEWIEDCEEFLNRMKKKAEGKAE